MATSSNTLHSIPGVGKWLFSCGFLLAVSGCASGNNQGHKILDETGIKGGLVVHLGCSDGQLTGSLYRNESYLVQGLDRDAGRVNQARKYLAEKQIYGKVTVDLLRGDSLPYADNTVNLLVSEDLEGIALEEVMRVLCPKGVAYIREGEGWKSTVKPRPGDIDEWTHFLHGADNNAVAHDDQVGLPYHLQWVGDTMWGRSHDHLAGVSALVSTAGRIFYIIDEGSTAALTLPAKWSLAARDAFNGILLWKRPIELWEGHLRGFRTGPAELPRRLVAVNDRVYVTLGYGKPVTALDAATGEIARTYAGTEGASEILYWEGILYVVAGDMDLGGVERFRGASPPLRNKRLLVIESDSGALLWKKADRDTVEVMPLTLAVADGKVFFRNPAGVVCLDARSGSEQWRVARPIATKRWAWSTPTLVVCEGVVLTADRVLADPAKEVGAKAEVEWEVSSMGGEAPPGELVGLDAETGRELWKCPSREAYNSPTDILIADGLVWTGDLVRAKDPGITAGRDLKTGEVVRTRPADSEYFTVGFTHHRCYRNKATDKYLLLGRAGVELIDLQSGQGMANHWVRGTCQYGIMPANGLLYAPPHSCACYIQSKLNGFNALAPRRAGEPLAGKDPGRLERGPAYDAVQEMPTGAVSQGGWPTYRHDAGRSGRTQASVAKDLKRTWETVLGGRLTSPVAADGKVYVAAVDSHAVHALNSGNGSPVWSHRAGGRVDSPPTVYGGLVLFGSADGYITCLRASDGALVWRFRAAPLERRIVAYGQLESVWPVHGNLLVLEEESGGPQGAVAYAVAGRSSFLDGGLYLYRLDPRSGEMLSENRIDSRDPETGLEPQDTVRGTDMPGGLPDILSSDGESIFMRHMRFNREGIEQKPDVAHLFSPSGFLDDSWWHRTHWMFGTKMESGWGNWPNAGNQTPAGRLLVVDQSTIYGFGRLNQYARHGSHVGLEDSMIPWPSAEAEGRARGTTHYELFACDRQPEVSEISGSGGPGGVAGGASAPRSTSRRNLKIETHWAKPVGLMARAMVLAGDVLFLAGPPEPFSSDFAALTDADRAAAQQAYDGKQGGLLWAVSPHTGGKLAAYQLESVPVLDGLIAADGRLFMSAADGRLMCFGEGP